MGKGASLLDSCTQLPLLPFPPKVEPRVEGGVEKRRQLSLEWGSGGGPAEALS